MTSLFERELRDNEFARMFAQESLISDATELICRVMEKDAISKSELAEMAGVSKSHITQLLSGSRNLTLRTLADLMYVMGERVRLDSTHGCDFAGEQVRFEVHLPKGSLVQEWQMTRPQASTGKAA